MKKYDYKLARKIIDKYAELGVLEEAYLGMHEDWFWTANTVWAGGEYKHPLPDDIDVIYDKYRIRREEGMSIISEENVEYSKNFIGGLMGSDWATPVLQVELTDGSLGTFRCYILEGEEVPITEKISKEMACTQGCLSGPVREWRDDNISIGDFKEVDDKNF